MFGKRIPLFRLFGIEIRLDLSWILIAVLITWTLSSGVFPGYYPNLTPATYWTMGVIAAAGLGFVVYRAQLASEAGTPLVAGEPLSAAKAPVDSAPPATPTQTPMARGRRSRPSCSAGAASPSPPPARVRRLRS